MKSLRLHPTAINRDPWGNGLLLWLAIVCSSLLFALHFFVGGGRGKLITDSYAYVELSLGQHVGVPFNTRLLQPLMASSVVSFTPLTEVSAFEFLTALELLASLVLIAAILRTRGATPQWQAAVVLTLGCSLAVTFGYTPVLVDPLVLLLVCLTIASLDRGYIAIALIFASLAALTKEYGILLGPIWAYNAYRRGHPRLAVAGALLPALALLSAVIIVPKGSAFGFQGPSGFLNAMLGYHRSLLEFRGAVDYTKILYMWSWCAGWPILLLGTTVLAFQELRRRVGREDCLGFTVMLVAVPFLLLGDWGRAMLVVVPFGCAVSTGHPLARSNGFALLLAAGGLSTALARPFHGGLTAPRVSSVAVGFISTAASALIVFTIAKACLADRIIDAFRVDSPIQETSVNLQ